MRAVWVDAFGGPEVLVVRDTPDPVAGPGQVVVDVVAASVVFIETSVRAGHGWPGAAAQPPYVPGNGVTGVVCAIGDGVDPAWLGRTVATTTGGTGGYAQRVAVASSGLIPVPAGLDPADAAALLADGRTAAGLVEAAAPAAGERVLVEAAAGAVGSLVVQWCAAAGAHVIGAVGDGPGGAKQRLVTDLGAHVAVDYRAPGWADGLDPVDVVFDGVGGAIGPRALATLRPGGRFVQYGMSGGTPTTVDRDDITLIGFQVLGAMGARAGELTAYAFGAAVAGRLRPVIGQRYGLEHASAAHRAIEARTTLGKTLLIP